MEMNSEPSGTDEDITGKETVVDIFILCKDDRDSQQLIGQLSPVGYRITLFTDSSDLLTSLREGKPNLLICDTSGTEQEGYEVCREIKNDEDLWRVPVLLVTGIKDLGDLLGVLDSNADNFIARPYNQQFLLSLVDIMLTSPVEKPDPEKIRTQFKIRHEDRDYVITADRRKLLEFLLSSFEMAVSRASELRHARRDFDELKATLEQRVSLRTSELDAETTRLQALSESKARDLENVHATLAGLKKEMDVLHTRLEDRESVISRVNQDLETTRARLAEAEDSIHTLAKEKDELEQALRGDAESLNSDLEQTRSALSATKKEYADLAMQHEALATQFAGLKNDHEESEKTLGARLIEIEQIRSTLVSEKNRADAAEQEVKSVLMEKARSEQDLRQMVEDITGKATQQSQECLRLSDELAQEKQKRETADEQNTVMVQETAKKDAAFAAQTLTLKERYDSLQQKYDALTESIGAERQKSVTLETENNRLTTAKDQVTIDMQALKEKLDASAAALMEEKHLRAGAEAGAQEIARKKEEEAKIFQTNLETLRGELENTKVALGIARQERDTFASETRVLNDKLVTAGLLKAESDKFAHSASQELEQVKEELETERCLHRAADEKLADAALLKANLEKSLGAASMQATEKEQGLQAKLRELSESLAAEQESHRATEKRLADAAREKDTIEKSIRAAGEQAAQKENVLLQKIQELSGSLAAEQETRRVTEEKLTAAAKVIEQAEEHLKVLSDSKETDRTRHEEELGTALDRQRSLEEQLRAAEREQAEKETALQVLSTSLEQAGVALEAEKERRHAAEEECAEAKDALSLLKKKTQIPAATIEEIPFQHHVVVSKGPELPKVFAREPVALTYTGQEHPGEPVLQAGSIEGEQSQSADEPDEHEVRIQSIEDLFEEAKELDVVDLPDAAIAPSRFETGGDAGVGREEPILAEGSAASENSDDGKLIDSSLERPDENSGQADEEEITTEPDTPPTPAPLAAESQDIFSTGDDEESGMPEMSPESDTSSEEITSYPPSNIGGAAFNRQQWFDLIKWAHNSETLSRAERIKIVKLGRLLQQGRRISGRQEAQLEEIVMLAHAQGYRPKE